LLTTGDAARLLGVTSQTVINWMEAGKLPFVRVGKGRRKVRPADMQRLIEVSGIPAHQLDPKLWGEVVATSRAQSSADHPLAVVDAEGIVLFWSPKAVERFGWLSSEIENRSIVNVPARVPGLPVDLADLAIQGGGDTFRTLLLELRHKGGTWISVEVTVSWFRDARGQSCGAIYVMHPPMMETVRPIRRRGAAKTTR
jgi:excisionase family DNA binding protein/PAS domain S-box-containing protein